MTLELRPPRGTETILRLLVAPEQRDAISGDLLEEYRAVRHPALGAFKAGVWYRAQVVSIVWRLLWPGMAAMAAVNMLASTLALPQGWLLQAPGISMLDAGVCLSAAALAARRTRLVATGALVGGTVNAAGVALLFVAMAVSAPESISVLLHRPALSFFPAFYITFGFGFGAAAGLVGGMAGRLLPAATRRPARP